MTLTPEDETLYSNRAQGTLSFIPIYSLISFLMNISPANIKLMRFTEALADAKLCIELKPDWSKGYYR